MYHDILAFGLWSFPVGAAVDSSGGRRARVRGGHVKATKLMLILVSFVLFSFRKCVVGSLGSGDLFFALVLPILVKGL